MNRTAFTRTIVRCAVAIGISLSLLLAGGAPGGHGNYVPLTSVFAQW